MRRRRVKAAETCVVGPEPDIKNVCNNLDDLHTIPHFCTYGAGTGGPNEIIGEQQLSHYCSLLGKAGEWESSLVTLIPCGTPDNIDGGVDVNNPYRYISPGILCGIPGGTGVCQRKKFNADPNLCCLQDKDCGGSCFEGNPDNSPNGATSTTCAPEYRSLVSSGCRDTLFTFCSGTTSDDLADPDSLEWINRWTLPGPGGNNCYTAIIRNTYNIPEYICQTGPPPSNVKVNANGYFWSQDLITAVIAKFTAQGFVLGSLPGSPTYHPFQDFLYSQVCSLYPGLCQGGLRNACSIYNAQQISFNPAISAWCGCYLPQAEYEAYSVKFNIPPQCTPMCNRAGVIPLVGINGEPLICEQDICLIDNITVNLVNSQIQGGLDINQVCGNCGPQNSPDGALGTCSCIIDNDTTTIVNTIVGGNIDIGQNCGNTTCTQTNPSSIGPNVIPVACGASANPFTEFETEAAAAQQKANTMSVIWLLIIIMVAIIVIFLIFRYIAP